MAADGSDTQQQARQRTSDVTGDPLRTVRNLTQNAFLEGFLTRYRTRKIVPYIRPGNVLDFGCGSHFYTLKALQGVFKNAIGLDQLFLGRPPVKHAEGFYSVGSLDDVAGFDFKIDQVVALACFEHFYESELRKVLLHIHASTGPDAQVIGTVPTPRAKPVLEFISYKLRLIDATQIEDHKRYYDLRTLGNLAGSAGWRVDVYKTFQYGMNSLFVFSKHDFSISDIVQRHHESTVDATV
jgi:hypothetical protein